ncbi:hypothetical protein ABH923_003533 [Leifsonia sp. EB41]|uniref:hypothetical protein n=1 Tax=Leifsonia sp. EB41 TaxID=3156260 RepID=UPI0035197732
MRISNEDGDWTAQISPLPSSSPTPEFIITPQALDPSATCFDTGRMFDFGTVQSTPITLKGLHNFTNDVPAYLKTVVLTNPAGITNECTSPIVALATLNWVAQ